jgi:dTDP-glucose 4,6-dehydratase
LPLDEHFAIGNFIRDALAGSEIVIKGDGTPYRSYLYPTDLITQLLALLVRGKSYRPYNVGDARAYSIREIATETSVQTGVGVEILGKPMPGARAARYVPDISRVQAELGVKSPIGISQAIGRTLEWHRGT